ncbi:hypothetical protein FSPOR_6164 [Fusarium sporotrichioides]|uniref:Transcription factor domain-containing protein n=1 Tax=Fusarium sporotrichioides TaxID=5514 RepID=A0A395S404_FUSSP|nr:hypothetical protein FSPOR_6164 [Fusarium sporotrichioides]
MASGMEIRASPNDESNPIRPAISRRSVHAINAEPESEQKIDDISRDVSHIKSLLTGLDLDRITSTRASTHHHTTLRVENPGVAKVPLKDRNASQSSPPPQWDHSSHVINLIKSIVQQGTSGYTSPEWKDTVSSLENLVNVLEDPHASRFPASTEHIASNRTGNGPAPPLEAILEILRWAKAHTTDFRISWICRFLPLVTFQEICTRVYFGVGESTCAEMIIANSFLAYVFAEYAVIHGDSKHREYCQFHRSSLGSALLRLPLLSQASMELVAAMTLGSLYMVEEGRASHAWTLISNAMALCQTLGYHRLDGYSGGDKETQTRLFWAVYSYENGLSLRLGRYSGIRDSDITLVIEPSHHIAIRFGRIQGRIYSQLYSPEGLASTDDVRAEAAGILAQEIQSIIDETHADITAALCQSSTVEEDPARVIYLHCDLVCQSSMMSMVLRAIPAAGNTYATDSCVTVARNTLDLHGQCMKLVDGCKDPLLMKRYISWAVLHTPFFPFSIVFENAVRHSNTHDLDRLDRFAASFKSDTGNREAATHPHRLYELLSQAARLCVQSGSTLRYDNSVILTSSDSAMTEPGVADTPNDTSVEDMVLPSGQDTTFNIGDWLEQDLLVFWGNQYESSDQFLRGVVVLCLRSPLKIEEIRIRLDGNVRHGWLADPGVAHNTNIFKHKWPPLVGASGKSLTLPAGNYEWPFEVLVPGDTPESLDSLPDASITYALRATINRGKLVRHASCGKKLRIIRTLAPTALEFMHNVSVEQTWTNKIDYSVCIPSKAVAFGSSVVLEIRVTPLVKGIELERIGVKLVEFHEFSMHSRHYIYTREHKSQREVSHWDFEVSRDQNWQDVIEETNQEGWVIKKTLNLPKALAECSQDIDAQGIKIWHKLKIHIPIRNQDGHVSHLDMGIPISICMSPFVTLDEQGNVVDRSTNILRQTAATVGPPLYGEHVLDQLCGTLQDWQTPACGLQPVSPEADVTQPTARLSSNSARDEQHSQTVPSSRSSSEAATTDSDEFPELSRLPTYRTALVAPLQWHNQPPGYQATDERES